MSSFYNQRQYAGGPIAKKPRLGPRPPHMMGPGNPHPAEDSSRLMSFKEFVIANTNNDINEQDALNKYSYYKTNYTKKQIAEFYKLHQSEEWFRNKYRPIEMNKIKAATKESKAKRKELYHQLIAKQNTDDLIIDNEHHENLSRFLENFSLLLEGATIEELDDDEARKKYNVSSIYIPFLHPAIDKAVIEEWASSPSSQLIEMLGFRPEYLRTAASEATPDRVRYRRHAWVTYKQMEYHLLRKLCWEYNNHKFGGYETKAVVNKEMNNRMRYTSFWFCHAEAAKADIKNVAKLLTHFEGEDCSLLESIKDYLIEETNEEEKMLGVSEQAETSFEFKQDQGILKALDRVILYLRVVHSYDYYASTEYNGEDDMPQRVGIMFARPRPPATYDESPQDILKEFIHAQKARIESFLDKPSLSEEELKSLGKRDAEVEVEQFIFKNTIEKVAGEKYMCAVTKKKFCGQEFVRKHILTKCKELLDDIRTEVAFHNNYVADPKRPM